MRNSGTALILLVAGLALAGCTLHPGGVPVPKPILRVKDNNPALWISRNPRVIKYRRHYLKTRTVETALRKAQRFIPTINAEFKRRNLPLELGFLPILESLFANRANSGVARGMWQFTKSTGRRMGLQIGFMVDERMDWRKATAAAAAYLDQLGAQFDYDWGLALASYNGGPGYISRAMTAQGTRSFFKLKLRKETYEYVPRFVAMLQVAREKFPRLMLPNY